MRDNPTNSDNVIDSRDVIKRIAELESDRDDLVSAVDDAKAAQLEESSKESGGDIETLGTLAEELAAAEASLKEWDEDNDGQELKALEELESEASGCSDWTYGETLIRDSYFEDYARELAEDIGSISKDASWPNNHIDWEEAADALKQDYTSVDFDGVTYWIRS